MSEILIAIQGDSPLLLNRFTDETAAKLSAGSAPLSIGSRGTPREQATIKLYTTADGRPMVPGTNVFRSIVDAGVFHKAGRRPITTAKTSLVPAAIRMRNFECEILHPDGRTVPITWEVDTRSVVNPATGGRMIAHRPRFDVWRLEFKLKVDEVMFDERLVRRLVDDAGAKIGLGEFRPARKGPFGQFVVVNWMFCSDEAAISST